MGFHQALARRYGMPLHLAAGGILSGVTDVLGLSPEQNTFTPNMPTIDYHPYIPDNEYKSAPVVNTFKPTTVTNSFTPNMPTNTFSAYDPSFAGNVKTQDFTSAIQQGQGGVGQGMAGLGSTFAAQQQLAAQAGQGMGQLQGNQQALYGQQQGLADALLAQSRGQGPNPAQIQLRQDTDRAIAQQASAMASQRGMNPALAARLIGQQGAQQNQQMAGQAALMGAQQQLAAQQALGQQQQAMGQNLLGQGSLQNATLANQGNLYNQAAGTAGSLGGLGANLYGTGVQGLQNQNALASSNSLATQGLNAGVAAQNANIGAHGEDIKAGVAAQNAGLASHTNDVSAGVAAQNADLHQASNAINAGVAAQNAGFGSDIAHIDAGIAGQNAGIAAQGEGIKAGVAAGNTAADNAMNTAIVGGLMNGAGGLASMALAPSPAAAPAAPTGNTVQTSAPQGQQPAMYAARGGQIPDQRAMSLAQALMGMGGQVPGKAKVSGDSAKNDTVPTVLSPDEIVIPRSIATAEDAPEKAAEFVAKLKGASKSGPKGYGKILEKHREMQKHMDHLEEIIRSQVG